MVLCPYISVYQSIMADTPSSTPAPGASTTTQPSKQPMIYICGGKRSLPDPLKRRIAVLMQYNNDNISCFTPPSVVQSVTARTRSVHVTRYDVVIAATAYCTRNEPSEVRTRDDCSTCYTTGLFPYLSVYPV